MLLILSHGTPRNALAGLSELRPCTHPGIWLSQRPAVGDLLLVDFRRLPASAPGTSVLRLIAAPKSRDQADAHIAALQTDPALLQSTRKRVLEALMAHKIPITDQEQLSIVDRLLRQGRQEGRRELVIALLAKRLGDDAAHKLAQTETSEQLEARLMRWIAEQ